MRDNNCTTDLPLFIRFQFNIKCWNQALIYLKWIMEYQCSHKISQIFFPILFISVFVEKIQDFNQHF